MSSQSQSQRRPPTHPSPTNWGAPPMEPLSAGYLSRKALPIKRGDAEPLTRDDVQFDMLTYIFEDPNAVFTGQNPAKTEKVTFCDLYLHALYSSSKCSKVLKDKMTEDAAFALELSKISLLVNIGRINTTMAFFPEMKTALRTYHPIPSLQKSDGNAQDAPRIKNCLKAALLPSEFKSVPPSTPEEILARSKANVRPPTSIVNLIFVLANHAAPLANIHFDGQINFLDLFLMKNISSADRAKVFLWLVFRYLEGPQLTNPFDDDYSRANGNAKAPKMRPLTDAEQTRENCDTSDEIAWGLKKSGERNDFLHRLVNSQENDKKQKPPAPTFVTVPTYKTPGQNAYGHAILERDDSFLFYVPAQGSPGLTPVQPPPRAPEPPKRPVYSPKAFGKQSMLWNAWSVIRNTDPLVDSDEECDESTRQEYSKRLDVISRLRGRPPTPEHQLSHVPDPSYFTGRQATPQIKPRWRTVVPY